MAVEIKVRGYHIDVYQHVNNARYLEFYELGRWVWLDRYGFLEWLFDSNLGFMVVNMNVNYIQGAVMGDYLTVTTRGKKIGTKSAQQYQRITRERKGGSEVVSDAIATFVFADLAANKAAPIEGELLKRMEALMKDSQGQYIEI